MRKFFETKIRSDLALRARTSAVGNLICILLGAYSCEVSPAHLDWGWVGVFLTLFGSFGRLGSGRSTYDSSDLNLSWQRRYAGWVILTAVGWSIFSSWAVLKFGFSSYRTHTTLLILSGITSASLVSLGIWSWLCRMFFSITLIPVTCLLGYQEFGKPEGIFPFAMVIYLGFLTTLSGVQFRSFRAGQARAFRARKEHERLVAVIDAFPGLVSEVSSAGRYKFINARHQDFTGSVNHATRGMRVGTPDGPLLSMNQAILDFLADPSRQKYTEELQLLTNGIAKWHLLTITRLNNGSGGILCVAVDIHEEKQHQADAEQQRAKALSSAKLASLGEMAAGIGHEVNNPLAVVTGWLAVTISRIEKKTLSPEQLLEGLSKAQRHCERIAQIVKNMRNLSRNSEGDPFVKVSFKQILQDVLETCQTRFEKAEAKLIFPVMTDTPSAELECRATEVGQVLINLLANALDAVAAQVDKRVELTLEQTENSLLIRVLDSGPGVPLEVRDKIMQPFFTTKQVGKGTGLGLSISSSIAAIHGGSLRLDPSQGRTCFLLTLPKKHPQKGAAAA